MAKNQKVVSDAEYEDLLSQYDYKFQKGDLVCGLVCGYDSEGAIVDIGAKTSAVVPTREAIVDTNFPIEKNLVNGEKYEFLIIRDEDEDGKMLLSYKKVAMAYNWKELEELKHTIIDNYELIKNGINEDTDKIAQKIYEAASKLEAYVGNLTHKRGLTHSAWGDNDGILTITEIRHKVFCLRHSICKDITFSFHAKHERYVLIHI